MADYGITDAGFVRKPFQQIYNDLVASFQSKLGNDFDVSEGSINQQFISTFADPIDLAWQGLQGIASSQTLNGAEGVYLDDLLSQQGFFREGKTKGGGQALALSNMATTSVSQIANVLSLVSCNNNITYAVTNAVPYDSFGAAYYLPASMLTVGVTYNFTIYTLGSPTPSPFVWTVSADNKESLLIALSQYINDASTNIASPAFYNNTTQTLYVGYNPSTLLPSPLPLKTLYVNNVPTVGVIGNIVDIEARTAGFNPAPINSLTSLLPTYTGNVGIINWAALSSGTDVQTDAEYVNAYQKASSNNSSNTEESIRTAVLKLEGTTSCVVWENPSQYYIYDQSSKLVCQPYTYNVVVEGGDNTEIANTILKQMPIGVKQYGTTTISLTDRNVTFTKAVPMDIGVRVSYQPKDNTPLSETQRQQLQEAYQELVDSLAIGDDIIPDQFVAATYSVLPYTKIRSIKVEVRTINMVDNNYKTTAIITDHDMRAKLSLDNILFERLPV
jgi:hypothetical protein